MERYAEVMLDAPSSASAESGLAVIPERRSQQRLRLGDGHGTGVPASVDPLVMLLQEDGRISRFNDACERASGWSAEEAVGRVLWECPFVPEQDRFPLSRALREFGSGCRVRFNDSCWRHRDGSSHVIHWTVEAIADARGAMQCIAFAGIDRTAINAGAGPGHRRLEQIAELHRIHIVEGLGTAVAHDLNQPLAAVALLAESALRRVQAVPSLPPDLTEDLEAI